MFAYKTIFQILSKRFISPMNDLYGYELTSGPCSVSRCLDCCSWVVSPAAGACRPLACILFQICFRS